MWVSPRASNEAERDASRRLRGALVDTLTVWAMPVSVFTLRPTAFVHACFGRNSHALNSRFINDTKLLLFPVSCLIYPDTLFFSLIHTGFDISSVGLVAWKRLR